MSDKVTRYGSPFGQYFHYNQQALHQKNIHHRALYFICNILSICIIGMSFDPRLSALELKNEGMQIIDRIAITTNNKNKKRITQKKNKQTPKSCAIYWQNCKQVNYGPMSCTAGKTCLCIHTIRQTYNHIKAFIPKYTVNWRYWKQDKLATGPIHFLLQT